MATDQPVMAVRIVDSSNTVLETLGGAASPLTLTEGVGESALTITGATQTSSFPCLTMTQTWNNAGTTFTAVKLDVTSTASAAASLLLDLQVGGISVYSITKAGLSVATQQANASSLYFFDNYAHAVAATYTAATMALDPNMSGLYLANNYRVAWSANVALNAFDVDLAITRSEAGVVAFGSGAGGNSSATIKAKTKAGAPGTGDVPDGTWALIRDTSGATTKLYYNNGGSLQSVALT